MICSCITKWVTITRPHWVKTLRVSLARHEVELWSQSWSKFSCNSQLYITGAYRWLRARPHSIVSALSYCSLILSPRYNDIGDTLPQLVQHTVIQDSKHTTWYFICLTSSGSDHGPLYHHELTLTPAWLSNHANSKVWNEITYPFPNFNGVISSHTSYWMQLLMHDRIKVKPV